MKHLLPALFLVVTPAIAHADPLEDACRAVLKTFLMKPDVNVGVSQTFPNLVPAGARMSFSDRPATDPAEMSDVIDCQFEKPGKPFGLQRFCISSTCYSNDEQNGDRRRRFEEVKSIVDQQMK
ncbi:hypothetical protein ACQ3G6_09620 [Allorhizobium undicola]|uniref:hypothetical protein n=1 Tax=Allorhizobium undicola TaxID=78527 RepID=UPI000483FC10|nr:hypothetical protein [Allorhizobium undicola]